MNRRSLVLIFAVSAFGVPVLADTPVAPYAGQQTRTIKALAPADVAALLKGEGMGMAKAAELNGYPGPLHVLTLSQELKLTETQRKQVQATFDRMSTAAKPLGSELVQHEQALDQLFAKQEITPDLLAAEIKAIADIQGRLRSVHLAAHLETRELLDPEQMARYQQIRGYTGPRGSMHHHHGG